MGQSVVHMWCSRTGSANVGVALTFRGMDRGEDQINETRLMYSILADF